MKTDLRIFQALAVLILLSSESAFGQSTADEYYRQWVDYRDGEISVDFDQTLAVFGLQPIIAKPGFRFVFRSRGKAGVLILRFRRQPLEPPIRCLFSTFGYKASPCSTTLAAVRAARSFSRRT